MAPEIEPEPNPLYKKIVNWNRPPRHRRAGFCDVTVPINGWLRLACAIYPNHIGAQKIHVPNHQRSGSKIVGPLPSHISFSFGAIVALASHLNRDRKSVV